MRDGERRMPDGHELVDEMPIETVIPTMRLLLIDGVLHQAFDRPGGGGFWCPVRSVSAPSPKD